MTETSPRSRPQPRRASKFRSWTRLALKLLIGLLIAAGVSVAVVAVAFDHDDPAPETPADGRAAEARNALCEAAMAVRQQDGATARQIFFGRAHQPLHELAAAAQEKSRAAAAALLEAKAKVETGFGLEPPATSLGDDLQTLARETGRALAVADGNDPGPCPPRK